MSQGELFDDEIFYDVGSPTIVCRHCLSLIHI